MFYPAWVASSNLFEDKLLLDGMYVRVLGESMLYSMYVPSLIAVYVLLSAIVPVIWKTKYALYFSMGVALISLVLMLDTLLFRYRYLFERGSYVVPTPTGYVTFSSPVRLSLGIPFWLLIAMLAVAERNLTTRASWLHWRTFGPINRALSKLGEGPLNAVVVGLRGLRLPYKRSGNKLTVDSLTVYEGMPTEPVEGEAYVFDGKRALHLRDGGKEEMSVEDAVRAILAAAVARATGVEENEYERERCFGWRSAGDACDHQPGFC
ncbi:MAG: hypothetical protein RAK25_05065 [TACK group archaeon]|nr:hypothetical protein [TACK group archaeon]